MTVFLSFRNRHQVNARFCKIFTHCAVNAWRIYQKLSRFVIITVIFHHSSIFNSRTTNTVKVSKIIFLKSSCDFQRPVTAEIKENNTVTINDWTYRFSVFCNNKFMHILIQKTSIFRTISIYSLSCTCKLATISQNMSVPSSFNH